MIPEDLRVAAHIRNSEEEANPERQSTTAAGRLSVRGLSLGIVLNIVKADGTRAWLEAWTELSTKTRPAAAGIRAGRIRSSRRAGAKPMSVDTGSRAVDSSALVSEDVEGRVRPPSAGRSPSRLGRTARPGDPPRLHRRGGRRHEALDEATARVRTAPGGDPSRRVPGRCGRGDQRLGFKDHTSSCISPTRSASTGPSCGRRGRTGCSTARTSETSWSRASAHVGTEREVVNLAPLAGREDPDGPAGEWWGGYIPFGLCVAARRRRGRSVGASRTSVPGGGFGSSPTAVGSPGTARGPSPGTGGR